MNGSSHPNHENFIRKLNFDTDYNLNLVNFHGKYSFQVMIASLAPTLPPLGRGRNAMPRYYLTWKFLDDCEQVIWHNRNRGMPWRRGHACMPPKGFRIIQRISTEPKDYFFSVRSAGTFAGCFPFLQR